MAKKIGENIKQLMKRAWNEDWYTAVAEDEDMIKGLVIGQKEYVEEVTSNTPWKKWRMFTPPQNDKWKES